MTRLLKNNKNALVIKDLMQDEGWAASRGLGWGADDDRE
jgi:hypothetical protein